MSGSTIDAEKMPLGKVCEIDSSVPCRYICWELEANPGLYARLKTDAMVSLYITMLVLRM